MILSDKTIKEYLSKGLLIENPINIDECIQPGSYDIYIGNQFMIPEPNCSVPTYPGSKACRFGIDISQPIEYKTIENDDYIIIPPKGFVLGVTKEIINLPPDISAFVEGRSSVGRAGLFIQNAGWIDAGFRGTITLELFNATDYTMKLIPNIRIGQIVFCKNDCECENPYNGKYQNQIDTTGSKLYKDYEDK